MKINDLKVKENITMVDKVNAINDIVDTVFTDGNYTPYYQEMAEVIASVVYFIDGLEFEQDEAIYDAVMNDEETSLFISNFCESELMYFVRKNVHDKVEFRKNQMIHSHADTDRIVEACNVIIDSLENFSKLNIKQISTDDMKNVSAIMEKLASGELNMDNISQVLKDAVGFNMDDAMSEILDAKNEEIRELKKYKALWESRNTTVSSDKVVPMKV